MPQPERCCRDDSLTKLHHGASECRLCVQYARVHSPRACHPSTCRSLLMLLACAQTSWRGSSGTRAIMCYTPSASMPSVCRRSSSPSRQVLDPRTKTVPSAPLCGFYPVAVTRPHVGDTCMASRSLSVIRLPRFAVFAGSYRVSPDMRQGPTRGTRRPRTAAGSASSCAAWASRTTGTGRSQPLTQNTTSVRRSHMVPADLMHRVMHWHANPDEYRHECESGQSARHTAPLCL